MCAAAQRHIVRLLRPKVNLEIGMLTRITPSLRIIFVIALAGMFNANTTSGAAGQADRARTIPLSPYVGLLRSITVTVANSAHPFILRYGRW